MGLIESWFEENKRDFPWRENRTPYRVWISEVMLQQTRASVVIPYFLRWMELFPDVKSLYMAPIEEVIKAWEGLGYYSRARNLHLAATQIVESFGGVIPDSREALLSIRGFGPYTVGAILSFAFRKKAPAVDGNVLRVVSRYFCIEESVSKASTRKKIEEKVETLLDSKIPWVTAEALIELGATVCASRPRCEICPLQQGCLGRERGIAEILPLKNAERSVVELFRPVFIFERDGFVLVRKGEPGKVMADLYEFPYAEVSKGSVTRKVVLKEALKMFGEKVIITQKLTSCTHTFTHYKARLFPYWLKHEKEIMITGFEWVEISRLSRLPFSSGHRKILAEVEKIYTHRYTVPV
jgi:A/G-specific adenine glycosylase